MKNNNKKIKNVFLGHTLEEYKSIYDIDKCLHIDKEIIDQFNKEHPKDTKDSPLEGRLWWLIDGAYYEVDAIVPKVKKHKKTRGPGFKIAVAGILGGVCIGGIGAGSYLIARKALSKSTEREIEIISPEGTAVSYSKETGKSGELNIYLKSEDPKLEIYDAIVSIGNLELPSEEYLLNRATQTVIIPQYVLENNVGNITVNVSLGDKIDNHVQSIVCPSAHLMKLGSTISFSDIPVEFNPSNPYDKKLYITCDNPDVLIDNGNQTLSCNTANSYELTIRSIDNPNCSGLTTLNVTTKVLTIEDSEGNIIKLKNFDINNPRFINLKLDDELVNATSYQNTDNIIVKKTANTGVYQITPKSGGYANVSFCYQDGDNEVTATLEFEIASYDELAIFEHYAQGGNGRYVVSSMYDKQAFKYPNIYIPTRYYHQSTSEYIYGDVILIGKKYDKYDANGFEATNITSITIPKSHVEGTGQTNITSIGKETFKNCTNLATVVLSEKITNIDDAAFKCETNGSLASINLEDLPYLSNIGLEAFANQISLKSIHIPAYLSSTGLCNKSFAGCTGLAEVTIDSIAICTKGGYNVNSELVSNANKIQITKNVDQENIDTNLINEFTYNEGESTDKYWSYTKN